MGADDAAGETTGDQTQPVEDACRPLRQAQGRLCGTRSFAITVENEARSAAPTTPILMMGVGE